MADGPTCFEPLEPNDDPALRARLAASHVAIIGCGGLGSNAAAMLVRSGVGELTIIDFDVVEESNLNRQMFFRDQLGLPKTEALAETLLRISPNLTLHSYQECVNAENLVGLVGGADVVVEAADRAEVKAMIANAALAKLPDTPLVSASGLAGFDSANDVVTERIGDTFYLVGDLRSDVRLGHSLFASRVMVAAAHEAHAAIRILLGYPEP
ncbi:MAG: sulfur carrier protein ThiS adenylyltransferase ThiF [Coriobacteriia bacterium]|nr:sulfur carrier protein ThiS adenylyltransferase ThiF [Coriobacteriia bacterium]